MELKTDFSMDLMKKEMKEQLVEIVDDYSSDEEEIALYSDYSREELEKME